MTQLKAPHSNPTNGERLVKAPASYSPNGPTNEDKMTNPINPNSRSIPDVDTTKIRGMTGAHRELPILFSAAMNGDVPATGIPTAGRTTYNATCSARREITLGNNR